MKLYIHGFSSYRSDFEEIDIKKELKTRYAYDIRRQDSFIHLAVLGAKRLMDNIEIRTDDELYVTSGIGNADLLVDIYQYAIKDGYHIKPFDFINMLGNTTSYYISQALQTKSKAIFQISNKFTYIHSLISAYSSIYQSQKRAVICCCDLISNKSHFLRNQLAVDEKIPLLSSVNYQLVSLDQEEALAEIEFENKSYLKDEILTIIKKTDLTVIASPRCDDLPVKKETVFFETIASNLVNDFIQKGLGLMFIDNYEEKYKIITLRC